MTRTPLIALLLLTAAPLSGEPRREASGDVASEPPRASARPDAGRALCLRCHEDLAPELNRARVHSPVAEDRCGACHNPHAARHGALLERAGASLCAPCHADVDAETHRTFLHDALRDERVCLVCHEPHSAERAALLSEPPDRLCTRCHAPIAAKLGRKRPHAPAAANECSTCHRPHGGEIAGLLTADKPALCFDCHEPAAALEARHRGFALDRADCGSCHDAHGSDVDHLVREQAHPPFAAGQCELCHSDARDPAKLTESQPGLCIGCHADRETVLNPAAEHPLGTSARCSDCHSPHAGEPGGQLRGAERALCLSCHHELREALNRAESIHPPEVGEGRCTTCHVPHDAPDAPLLRRPAAQLCAGCHESHARFTHPMGENVPDVRRPGHSLDCLSCHNPHASDQPMLLIAAPDRALCVGCHQQLH